MPNDLPQDPLEGKGEEMIPDRGLPFDDIDDTPLEDIPPEERIPDFPEEDLLDMDVESALEENSSPSEETPFATDEQPPFGLSEVEAETMISSAESSFDMEATPWGLSNEEAETFVGSTEEVFTPSEAFVEPEEDRSLHGPPDESLITESFDSPPEEMPDAGMSTHLDEDPREVENLFSEASFQSPGPAAHAHPDGEIVHAAQPSEQSMVEKLVTDEAVEALWRRADKAQADVNRHITTLYIARPLLDHIQAARNELMAGKEYYDDAERHINEVEYRVHLSTQLDKWAKTLIPRLYIYLAIWFILSITALFLIGESAFSPEAPTLIFLAGSMVWGGVGGIIGALLPLGKHFSEKQDFSPRHTWWYLRSPFIGAAMGAIIFLFVLAGALSIAGGEISSPYVIYILAGLAGYQHNIFTDLVKRMLKVLQIEDSGGAKVPKTDEPKTEE